MPLIVNFTDQRLKGGDFPTLSGLLSVQNKTDYNLHHLFITIEFRNGSLKSGDIIESTDHLAPGESRSWKIDESPMDENGYDSYYLAWQGMIADNHGNVLEDANITLETGEWTNASGCYVVTACAGSPNDSTVDFFRAYRDNVLEKSSFGKLLVRIYEFVGPYLANIIRHIEPLRRFSFIILSHIAKSHYLKKPARKKEAESGLGE